MTCPVAPDKALGVLRAPGDPMAYRSIADGAAEGVSDALRSDLLARYVLAAGAPVQGLLAMIMGRFLFNTRHFPAIVEACRRAGLPLSDNLYSLERMIARHHALPAPVRVAFLQDFLRTDDLRRGGQALVVAAMPKSASTFFCTALQKVVGGPMTTPHNRNDALGVGYDLLDFLRSYFRGGVMHSHLDASDRVVAMARLLEIRPVVQTRNIFDALASYIDHAETRAYAGSQFAALDAATRRRVVIMRMARHYVDMVASWSRVESHVPVLWVDFDAVRTDLAGCVERALSHAGRPVDHDAINRMVATLKPAEAGSGVRFNKGKPGRGAMFPDGEKAWVRTLYLEYPEVDFTCIDPELAALSGAAAGG